MNLQESIRRILREVRVPRNERVELYKDNNIIVVVPLTHRALQKYAHQCQWCINDDKTDWEDYHQGKHAVIIQRNPKKPKMGITGHPTASEIFFLAKWDNNQSSFEDVCQILDYEFRNDRTMADYYTTISNDINNFGTNIVYYSPENGVYDQEDNFLWNFNYEISDIPNVTPEVIKIMDNYLQEEEMSLQESIRRILREETKKNPKVFNYKKYTLILSNNPCDIFTHFKIENLHGLNYKKCLTHENTKKSAYIAGLTNISPKTKKHFLFLNLNRLGKDKEKMGLIMHETMHLSLELYKHDVENKEEEIITFAENEAYKIYDIIQNL